MEVLDPQANPVLNVDATLGLLVIAITCSFVALVSCLFQYVPRTDTLLCSGKDLLNREQVDLLGPLKAMSPEDGRQERETVIFELK